MKKYLVISLMLWHFLGEAQNKKLFLEQLSTEDGLSSMEITCVFQDKKGYLWIGTEDGLNRYDGYKIKVFKKNEFSKDHIPGNTIRDIVEDDLGKIWVATNDGLCSIDPIGDKIIQYTDKTIPKLSNKYCWSIFIDPEKKLWVATEKFGINIISKDLKTITNQDNSKLPYLRINSSRKPVFITNELIYSINSKEQNYCINTSNLKYRKLNSLGNNILIEISPEKAGLISFNCLHNLDKNFNKKDSIKTKNRIIAAQEDSKNQIIIAQISSIVTINIKNNDSDTINLYDNYTQQPIEITSIYKTREGVLWISSKNGLFKFNKQNRIFKQHDILLDKTQINNYKILSIEKSIDSNIIVNTSIGQYSYDFNTTKLIKLKNKFEQYIKNKNLTQLSLPAEDKSNGYSYITTEKGLLIYNNKKIVEKKYDFSNFETDGSISIKSKYIYVINKSIILKLDKEGNKIAEFDFQNLKNNSRIVISEIFEDKNNDLWLGTRGLGIFHLNKDLKLKKHFMPNDKDKNSLCDIMINDISIDDNNILWAATKTAGIWIYDINTNISKVLNEENGLISNRVNAINATEKNHLWIANSKGISRLNTNTFKIKNFDFFDGVVIKTFNYGRSITIDNNTIAFCNKNGFISVNINKLELENEKPQLLLTSFIVGNSDLTKKKDINKIDKIILRPGEDYFSFEFAAIHFNKQKQNKYMYMLKGLDKDWKNASSEDRNISYSNLDQGNYTLKLKVANHENLWNENIKEIKIIVEPTFWSSWWFRGFLIITIIGVFYILYTNRIKSIKNQELKDQVAERTKELTSKNDEIQAYNHKINELYYDIKQSIVASKYIQESILPTREQLNNVFGKHCLMYQPKDVVGGDFYWLNQKLGNTYFAVADCSGHGVSGALMSMTGFNILNYIIESGKSFETNKILDELNERFVKTTGQSDSEFKQGNGMDICIVRWTAQNHIQYSAAKIAPIIIRNNEIIKLQADKFSIGTIIKGELKEFQAFEYEMQEGDKLYIYSDGYADQLDNLTGDLKLMNSNFRNHLIKINNLDYENQEIELKKLHNEWKGDNEQTDDILVIGIDLRNDII